VRSEDLQQYIYNENKYQITIDVCNKEFTNKQHRTIVHIPHIQRIVNRLFNNHIGEQIQSHQSEHIIHVSMQKSPQ